MSRAESVSTLIAMPHGVDLPLVLRPMEKTDRGHVLTTWVTESRGRRCEEPMHSRGQMRLAEALIERCPVTIAAFDEDPSVIIGWACTSIDTVHFVYVRFGDAKDVT